MDSRVQLRPDVQLGRALLRGPAYVHFVTDPLSDNGFEVGPREYFLMSRLDGERTLGEIGDEYAVAYGRRLGESNWLQLLGLLGKRGLLSVGAAPPASASGPVRAVERIYRALSRVFAGRLLLGALLVSALATLAFLLVRLDALLDDAGWLVRHPLALLAAGGVLWTSATLHELGHGVAALWNGCRVTKVSLAALHCRIEGYQSLRSLRAQLVIAGIGGVVNLLVLVPLAVAWALAPSPWLGGVLFLGLVQTLLNYVPLPPLDGYRMLSHALNAVNLAPSTLGFAGVAATRGPALAAYPARAKRVYVTYGLIVLVVIAGALIGALVTARAMADDRLVVTAIVGVSMSIAGWMARPARKTNQAVQPPRETEKARSMTDMEVAGADAAVELIDIHKRYGDVPALRGISLTVPRGEFFGIVGPNGAGKTTLVEIAEGLRDPDSGLVRVLGLSPTPRDEALLLRIGVHTQSSAFFPRLTAQEHLRTVAALYGALAEAAERALALVDLQDAAHVRVDRLSGGQRQRLAIASALTHDPNIIFLDEPTASLDPEARRSLWQTLRGLKAAGRTIVYTTHHLDEAEALCDRVAVIVDGVVIALGSPQELMRSSSAPSRVILPSGRITVERASRLDGAASVTEHNGSLIIETSSTGRVLTAIGDTVGLDEVQTRTATLEDIYLELTGSRQAS